MTLPNLYNIDALEILHRSVQSIRNPEAHLTLGGVVKSIAVRVACVAISVLAAVLGTVATVVDMSRIAQNLSEHNCSVSTIIKTEFLYLKAVMLGAAQLAEGIIAPELIITNAHDMTNSIQQTLLSFIKSYVSDVRMCCSLTGISEELLPDHGARLNNFQNELEQLLHNEVPIRFDALKGHLTRLVSDHYSREEISWANKNNLDNPLLRVVISGGEQEVEQLVNNGNCSIVEMRSSRVRDIIERRFGTHFLNRLTENVFLKNWSQLDLQERAAPTWQDIASHENESRLCDALPLNSPNTAELFVYFLENNKLALAEKLFDRFVQAPIGTLSFWPAKEDRQVTWFCKALQAKSTKIAKALLPGIDVNRPWGGSILLDVATFSDMKEIVDLLIEKGAHIFYTSFNGVIYESIEQQFGASYLINYFEHVDVKKTAAALSGITYFLKKNAVDKARTLAHALHQLPDADKVALKDYKAECTALFFQALFIPALDIALNLIPYIAVEGKYTIVREGMSRSKTPLIAAAEAQWKEGVVALIAQGADPFVEEQGTTTWYYISNNFSKEEQQQFLLQCISAKPKGKAPYLAVLTKEDQKCGIFAEQLEQLLSPYGIPKRFFDKNKKLTAIRNYIASAEYRALESVTEEKKQEAALYFLEDPAQLPLFNLLYKETNPNHMRYAFSELSAPTIKELPEGFSIQAALQEFYEYVLPKWPDEVRVQDDNDFRSKESIQNRIRHQIIALDTGTMADINARAVNQDNQQILKKMYGNILLNICERIRAVGTLSPKEKEALDRELRSFIQSLGITMYHCTDRIMADSKRYYFRFVDNKKKSIEESEQLAVEDILHGELLRLRRQLFNEVYFSIDTDSHDVATQRYMESYFNQEMGLHLPEFDASDSYQRFALQEKIVEIEERFYKTYTPVRIAQHLQSVIKQAIDEQARKGTRQSWFTKIQAFLENKHTHLNWNRLFDLENNTFTSDGMDLLLCDLGIIV